ncbi:MAG: sensor domain-containing diguanylate cyclase [Marinospirillum sp.]|uniref:sensor domain-containing diguanylate cyclase n=1 Tax=Marinospirillum sp. TaxID=2183934 RepID=UPI0019DE68EA|nr:sensor domain-containing diguanylate cyclase [Marinospirillum sp.]MBE0506382.1 sensor domain-containing diguanylate cyclase [Marinospirillum sp.]
MNIARETSQVLLLRRRILLIALLGVLITSVVASLSTTIPFYISSRLGLEKTALISTQAQASVVENLLGKYQDLARQFTSRTEIRRRLEAYAAGEMTLDDLIAFTQPRLADAMSLSSEILGMIRVGPAGEVVVRLGKTPSIQDSAVDLTGCEEVRCQLIQLDDQLVVRVSAPLVSGDGVVIGRDVLFFNSAALAGILADPLRMENQARVFLAQLEQQLVVGVDYNTGQVLIQPLTEPLVQPLQALDRVQSRVIRPDQMLKGSVLFYAPVHASGWGLVAEIPARVFYFPVWQQLLWPLAGILVMMLLAILVLSRALQPLVNRLTDQAQALEEVAAELHLAASVFEGTHEAIAVTDEFQQLVKVNAAFSHITGFDAGDVLGRSLISFFHPDESADEQQERIWEPLQRRGSWQGEIRYRCKEGEPVPVLQSISPVMNEQGELQGFIHIFNDISEHKAVEERIHHLAHYDQLTDLPNRTLLNQRLKQALNKARSHGSSLAILFMDLDHFKEVNDTLGHPVGDKLLQAVAKRVGERLRELDTLGRLGGDEFLVLLEHSVSRESAARVADKIIQSLTEPFSLDGHEIRIGVSIGISLFPDDGDNTDDLVKHADIAMYRAKENGRNNYQYFSPGITG